MLRVREQAKRVVGQVLLQPREAKAEPLELEEELAASAPERLGSVGRAVGRGLPRERERLLGDAHELVERDGAPQAIEARLFGQVDVEGLAEKLGRRVGVVQSSRELVGERARLSDGRGRKERVPVGRGALQAFFFAALE